MAIKQWYNFKEAELGPSFAQDKLKEFKSLIDAGISFVVLSMPGVGVSYFLKYLAMQNFAHFIHVDLYNLPTLSQHEFYKLLLSELGGKPGSKTDDQLLLEVKKAIAALAQKKEKVVIIFSRFDQLKSQFDWNFLSNIQSLSTVVPDKVVLIFTSVKPMSEIVPAETLAGGNLNFYSEILYFKPYSKNDLKELLKIEPSRPVSKETLEQLLNLSGSHNQLLHILLSSQKKQFLLDQFVKMQMKELVNYLDYHQRKQIQKIALAKKIEIEEVDEYLLGVGMAIEQSTSEVKKTRLHFGGVKFELFTPLLSEYIKTNLPVKLPVKEAKLFKLLHSNIGRTVTKDEIFAVVWESQEEGATDWALDALIYRLRNHPFMKAHGYIIESQKKVGYTLIQT
ncbi:MAG: helix-turn-helix domain-containing protein [Candidatus Daviesbacteria bacterium]|nr:helix-turn-helix domain-containing protein [Candidatus Daviesbacteria bacterium]